MTTKVVRILIEDKATQELRWYAEYDCADANLNIALEPDGVRCEGSDIDNLLTTFNTTVSDTNLAIELFRAFCKSSGVEAEWNVLPLGLRQNWIAVAKRVAQLGPLFVSPEAKPEARHAVFDFSDVAS